MRLKKFISALIGFTALGVLIGFSSCNNERPDDVDKKCSVTTEALFIDEDGNLQNIDLRTIDSPKGTITGDGLYDYNASVTVTATAKSSYTLHKLYEKDGKGGFTERDGVFNSNSKSLTFNIKDDMHFVAVFMTGGSERGYRNLKLDNALRNYSYTTDGDEATSETVTAVGEQVAPRKTADGTIIDWNQVVNASYKEWDIEDASPESWVRATINTYTGVVSVTTQPYISKYGRARSATIKVGKDGDTSSAPKAWRNIVVTQNSYYVDQGSDEPDVADGDITYGDGSVAGIPATLTYEYAATGGNKDFTTLHKSLNTSVYALIPTYKNGVKQPKSAWVKKPLTVTLGSPSASWLRKAGNNYSAGVNNTSSRRTATVNVNFVYDGYTVKTITITASQNKKQYEVGGEIK